MEKEEKALLLSKFVNENYKEIMNNMYDIIQPLCDSKYDDKRFGYEMGFITALNWFSDLLGLELNLQLNYDRIIVDKRFDIQKTSLIKECEKS